ncbi:nuclear transport factor 2 family protein [Algiphilus sp.]|uniref:nuclear transport factor 2 family protein n=1 Tax=Algiphilus sp. TaxID=1872431 RepID=UPI003C41C4FF
MSTTEERLDRMEAIEALRRLKHEHYCLAVDRAVCRSDRAEYDALVERLAPDIEVSFTGFGRFSGKEAAAPFFIDGVGSMLSWCQHRVGNPIIDVDGDTARGQWTVFCPAIATDAAPTGPGPIIIVGRYDERYRRTDGRWYWTHLDARLELLGPAEAFWQGAAWAE